MLVIFFADKVINLAALRLQQQCPVQSNRSCYWRWPCDSWRWLGQHCCALPLCLSRRQHTVQPVQLPRVPSRFIASSFPRKKQSEKETGSCRSLFLGGGVRSRHKQRNEGRQLTHQSNRCKSKYLGVTIR